MQYNLEIVGNFFYVIENNNLALFDSLLQSYPELLNVEYGAREVPLHIAAKNGNLELVQTLLQKGANSMAKTISGKTPLDYIKENEKNIDIQIREKIISILKRYSREVNSYNIDSIDENLNRFSYSMQ